jgi:MFS family permease
MWEAPSSDSFKKTYPRGMSREPRYRWVIVALGALMGCVSIGALFSLAVFQTPMSQTTEWSRAGISAAMTINFLVLAFGSFLWGSVSDRFGPRIVTLIGAVLLGLALVLASRATSLLLFQLTFGFLMGLSVSAFFAPMIAAVTGWFETRRSLAVSLVSAGVGVAPVTISPLAAWLLDRTDWRSAMLIIGLIAWALLVPAALFVRRPPTAPPAPAGTPVAAPGMKVSEAITSKHFLILGFTFFACCAAHSGPIFHVISYATWCGIGLKAATSIYSVEGVGGLGGRLLLGLLADRYGAKWVLVGGLLVQSVAITAYLAARGLGEFYVIAAIFGIAYGGVMPLYAVLARDYFGQNIMGSVFGAATMLSSLGMAIGPLAGGWVFDTFGTYAWLYVGSGSIALAATLLALFFPRSPADGDRPRGVLAGVPAPG